MSANTDPDWHSRGQEWYFKQEYGFDAVPSADEMITYYKALLICVNGDGELAEQERDWVLGYAAVVGTPAEYLAELRDYAADERVEDVVSRFDIIVAASRCIIRDAIRACAADGTVRTTELDTIRRMNRALGHPDDLVDRLLDLHVRQADIDRARSALFWPETGGRPY
ncbi:hypothetical protein ACFYY8_41265 [Streptosporangium sp. NPDC001559]|uniref:hypothetical protein n=1 Tax=Streptosporangium sp. NPDC001559 TaxID=3366187 RepID=UPI0036E86E40